MKIFRYLYFFLLASLSVGIGCNPPSSECDAFYKLPRDRQHSEFRALPIEKQLDIYICGTLRRHPPDIELAYDIAEGGKNVIPSLLERTRFEKDDAAKEELIYVFQVMCDAGYLTDRGDVIDELDSIGASMEWDDSRDRSRLKIEEIKGAQRRHSEFLAFPIEKQLGFYLSGTTVLDLPATGLAYDIAQRGEEIIPDLLDRAEMEKDDAKEKLIDVFEILSNNGDLRGRQVVLNELDSIVGSMGSKDSRDRVQLKVEKIKHASS